MPNGPSYSLAREKRKPALHEATPGELKTDPGVQQLKKAPEIKMGQGMHQVEPGDPGTGRYSDRIKIEPKIKIQPTPKLSDTEIQRRTSSAETKI